MASRGGSCSSAHGEPPHGLDALALAPRQNSRRGRRSHGQLRRQDSNRHARDRGRGAVALRDVSAPRSRRRVSPRRTARGALVVPAPRLEEIDAASRRAQYDTVRDLQETSEALQRRRSLWYFRALK